MKSLMVGKCRNSAPSDTCARCAITFADARAYPTSMIVSMLASSNRAMVSSRRCCCVLAISDGHGFPLALARLEEPPGLHGLTVALAELALAENHLAVDAGRHDR